MSEKFTSTESLEFKMINGKVTVDSDNKVSREVKYEVITTGGKGQYKFPTFESACEALLKKGFTENLQYVLVKNSKGEDARKIVGKSLAQVIVLGLRALNSQEQVEAEKKAFNNSPEKTDSQYADFARKVLANDQATAAQKEMAQGILDKLAAPEVNNL